jgi:hypothetical protein
VLLFVLVLVRGLSEQPAHVPQQQQQVLWHLQEAAAQVL